MRGQTQAAIISSQFSTNSSTNMKICDKVGLSAFPPRILIFIYKSSRLGRDLSMA